MAKNTSKNNQHHPQNKQATQAINICCCPPRPDLVSATELERLTSHVRNYARHSAAGETSSHPEQAQAQAHPVQAPTQMSELEEFLATCALAPTEWNLSKLERYAQNSLGPVSLDGLRSSLYLEVPFRVIGCTHGLTGCCGNCTQTCSARCVQDIMHRIFMMCSNLASGRTTAAEEPLAVQLLLRTASDFNSNANSKAQESRRYEALTEAITSIISPKYNPALRRTMHELGIENPYKYNYAPAYDTAYSHEKGKWVRQVDKETGIIKLLEWPTSGLCPYCLPRATINKRYAK